MKNLQQIIVDYLDSIGADGLMVSFDGTFFGKDKISEAVRYGGAIYLVPAYRHADGTYHTEPEHWFLCKTCICDCMPIGDNACTARFDARECTPYQSWLSHKEGSEVKKYMFKWCKDCYCKNKGCYELDGGPYFLEPACGEGPMTKDDIEETPK